MALLVSAGERAQAVFDSRVRGIAAKYVEADEVWSFLHTKEARLRVDDPEEWGHSYLWVGLDATSKMVLAFHVGKRTSTDASQFISELAHRVKGHFRHDT
jgi:hypothetical protein